MSTTFEDQPARDRIAGDLHRNLLVEAGAGTGKTTVLVGRIVALLRTGTVEIDELVVITFTHRAATEIAGRVRTGLERAYATADPHGDEHRRIAAALADLHRARIETIHAFATALLRQRPIEAGLDPQFEPLDAAAGRRRFEDEFDLWRHGLLEAEDDRLVRALGRGFGLDKLHDLVDALSANRAVLPLAPSAVAAPDPAPFRAAVRDAAAAFADAREACTDQKDKAFAQLATGIEYFDACLASDDVDLEDLVLARMPKLSGSAGSQGNYSPASACKAMKASLKEFKAAGEEYGRALRSQTITDMLALAEGFVTDAADRRRADGLVDFDDLLLRARDLLRDDEDVRRGFRAQYRAVVIDEFQDTDPVQAELALLLTCDEPPGEDWQSATPAPGALTVVGDPKQSISRFRRADIAIYDAVKRGPLSDGNEGITQNFRSRSRLLRWSNAVFAPLLGDGVPGVQAQHVPLVSTIDPDLGGRAPIVVLPGDGTAVKADEVRTQEADRIARLVHRAVVDERWLVRDRETGEERSAVWRDVVVLMRTRASLAPLEASFARYGVPFRGSGGGGWYAAPEVRDLAHLLRAADDPTDSFSVVGALRSGACGCSDDDLVRYHALAGRFDPRRPHADGPQSVLDGLALIAGLHRERRGLTLSELVRRAIERTGLIPFSLAGLGGAQPAANARQLLALARTVEGSAGGGLREFVRWIERQRQLDLDEDVAGVTEDADDVVRAMTMHGAKGLEFPIVVLAGLANKPNNRNNPIPLAAEHRLELKLGSKDDGFATPGWDDALAQEKVQLEAELRRLLYVAVTRARDFLVVPAIPQTGKPRAGTFLELLEPALPEAGDPLVLGAEEDVAANGGVAGASGADDLASGVASQPAVADASWNGQPWAGHDDVAVYPPNALASVSDRRADEAVSVSAAVTAELAEAREDWSIARAARRTAARRGRRVAAASAQHAGGFDGHVGGEPPLDGGGPLPGDDARASDDADRRADEALTAGHPEGAGRTSRAAAGLEAAAPVVGSAMNRRAADIGSAVHLVMERVPLADPEVDLTDLVRDACQEFEVGDASVEVEEMSRNCLRSAPVREAAKAGRLWRELAVAVQDGEVTTMGRIDLLFEAAGELVLVDYKTDRVGATDIAALEARHAPQMAAYAASIRAATGLTITRTEVVPARVGAGKRRFAK